MASAFFKEPWETFTVAVDFAPALPTGETILSGTVSAQDLADGSDQSAVILGSTIATISGTQALVLVKAGTAGHLYNIRFRVLLSAGPPDGLEENATLSVQQDGT